MFKKISSALAVSALVLAFTPSMKAAPITGNPTPSGTDPYRLIFTTSVSPAVTDTNMALLNTFVTDLAQDAGAVDAGGALGTTWSVVGATSTVDVFTNTGLAATGGVPIYLTDGTLVAADNAALWALAGTNLFDVNEDGVEGTQGPGTWVHTGLDFGGPAPITAVGAELDTAAISHGGQDAGYNPWYGVGDTWAGGIDNGSLFAVSGVIDGAPAVVPEPASIAIWSLLGLCLAGYGYLRRRRNS